jgi:hypothetical protein
MSARSLAAPGDHLVDARVGIADQQLDPGEAALAQAVHEQGSEIIALTLAHLNAEHLALASGSDADGCDHEPGNHLPAGHMTAMHVRRVMVDVGVAAEIQWAIQAGLHLDVEPLAHAADLRFGDATLTAQRRHQLIDLANRDT